MGKTQNHGSMTEKVRYVFIPHVGVYAMNDDCTECDGQGVVYISSRWASDGLKEIPCPECTPDYEPNYEDMD